MVLKITCATLPRKAEAIPTRLLTAPSFASPPTSIVHAGRDRGSGQTCRRGAATDAGNGPRLMTESGSLCGCSHHACASSASRLGNDGTESSRDTIAGTVMERRCTLKFFYWRESRAGTPLLSSPSYSLVISRSFFPAAQIKQVSPCARILAARCGRTSSTPAVLLP